MGSKAKGANAKQRDEGRLRCELPAAEGRRVEEVEGRVVGALAQEQGAMSGSDECEWTRLVGGSSLEGISCREARAPERHLWTGGGDLAAVNIICVPSE
jgi:hypothetical protein